MVNGKKVPVSERALLARINRKLAGENRRMKKCREDSSGYSYLGAFYEVDTYSNTVDNIQLDLVQRAQELQVMQPFEELQN